MVSIATVYQYWERECGVHKLYTSRGTHYSICQWSWDSEITDLNSCVCKAFASTISNFLWVLEYEKDLQRLLHYVFSQDFVTWLFSLKSDFFELCQCSANQELLNSVFLEGDLTLDSTLSPCPEDTSRDEVDLGN